MRLIGELKIQITHLNDGPLTPFVVINRACDALKNGVCSVETASNAIYEVFEDYGWFAMNINPISNGFSLRRGPI